MTLAERLRGRGLGKFEKLANGVVPCVKVILNKGFVDTYGIVKNNVLTVVT